jgi:hypothetical protein
MMETHSKPILLMTVFVISESVQFTKTKMATFILVQTWVTYVFSMVKISQSLIQMDRHTMTFYSFWVIQKIMFGLVEETEYGNSTDKQ